MSNNDNILTIKNLKKYFLYDKINKDNIIISEPVGYLDFLALMVNCKFILTDSGGIQEEASYLKIPILTLRENTERPITISEGTNELVGKDLGKIKYYINQILSNKYKKGKDIEKWDGKTSERIVKVLKDKI